jgi:hypothetical protein
LLVDVNFFRPWTGTPCARLQVRQEYTCLYCDNSAYDDDDENNHNINNDNDDINNDNNKSNNSNKIIATIIIATIIKHQEQLSL